MNGQVELSASMQDYLEAVLELQETDSSVRVTDIANKLNIAKASVNQTINKLKDMGYVSQETYGPVELTHDGRELAVKVRERHRMLSRFLVEALGVDQKVAEKDACLMEHVVSPQTMERLTEFLNKNGYMPKDSGINSSNAGRSAVPIKIIKSLNELKTGEKGKVVKVTARGVFRKRLLEMGITNGAEIVVKGFAPFGDPMELGVKGYNLSLRKAEAADIQIEMP